VGRQSFRGSNSNFKEYSNIVADDAFEEFFFLIIVTTDALGICFPIALLLILWGAAEFLWF